MNTDYAKGPQPIGFQRIRTLSCPIILEEDVCDYPQFVLLGQLQIKNIMLPGCEYFNMNIEDFEPYKKLGEPIILHGPEPYYPSLCACNRYMISSQGCVCASSCIDKPLYKWFKQNPERFQQKLNEMTRWRKLWQEWSTQKEIVATEWYYKSRDAIMMFVELQDCESTFGCARCEKRGLIGCDCCKCRDCGSKFCDGCYYDSDDYDY